MEEINLVNMYNYLFLYVIIWDISVFILFFDNSVGYLVNVCVNINFNLGVNIIVLLIGKFFFWEISVSLWYFYKFCVKEKKELYFFDCGFVVYVYILLWCWVCDNKVWKLLFSCERDVILCEIVYIFSFDLV